MLPSFAFVAHLESAANRAVGKREDWPVAAGMDGATYAVCRIRGASVIFNFQRSANTCFEDPLHVRYFDGPIETPQDRAQGRIFWRNGREIESVTFMVDRDHL